MRQNPDLLIEHIDHFLASIRADPPNVLVSSRVVEEGVVQREWPKIPGGYSLVLNDRWFPPKWLVMVIVMYTYAGIYS